MKRLQDKSAIITGGGAGIGAATGRIFCQEGAAVLLVDRDSAALEETASAIREQVKGAKVAHCVAEVSDADEAVRAVAQAKAEFGRLDVLVNNAAMRNYASMAEATHEDWLGMLGVNLIGAANYAKAALP